MFVIFNKDKKFVAYSDNFPDNHNFLKREIPADKLDLKTWRWEGDYDTGSFVPINDSPYPKTKKDLQKSLFDRIYKEYPIDLQNVIIIKQLQKICNSYGNNFMNDDFKDMSDLILKAVENYEHDTNFYLK
jgi:hypothetical protein